MLDIFDYIIILLLGSFGGFVSGFLGVGGGIIYIPILDFFLYKMGMRDDMLVKGILANSLFTIIFSGTVASYKQYKMGNFYPKEIVQTAIPGMVSALLLTYFIKSGTWYSRTTFLYVFAGMLLIIMVRMFLSKSPTYANEEKAPKNYQYNLTGFFAGIITAFSGLGGGVVMTPVFTDVLKQNIKKASSISNGVIPLFAVVVGVYNLSSTMAIKVHEWQVGYIVLPVVLPMIFSTFFFAPLGVKIAQKTKARIIRNVFASFVSIVFFKLVYELYFK